MKGFLVAILIGIIAIFPVMAAETPFAVDFDANITSGYAPLAVQFNNLVTGSPVNCSWGIEGTLIKECQGPVHTFTIPGSYDINLTATDSNNVTFTQTKFLFINVTPNDNPISISFRNRAIAGNNQVVIVDKLTGIPAFVGNTSSTDIRLKDGNYNVVIGSGGITDYLNSPDYGLTIAAQIVRTNLIGIILGGSMLFLLIGFFFWRKS